MKLRFHQLFYGVAVAAASYNVTEHFGWGTFIAGWICVFWYVAFSHESVWDGMVRGTVLSCIPVTLLLMLSPTHSHRRAPGDIAYANRQAIGWALQCYHDDHGVLPPACIKDTKGRPMHSWRVLILPYLERNDLYRKYNFDEPWDSPHNLKLLDERPRFYASPFNEDPDTTFYAAVSGPNTLWPDDRQTTLADCHAKGTEHTALALECHSGIKWTEPRDLDIDNAVQFLSNQQGPHSNGKRYLLMAGGFSISYRYLTREKWRSILSLDTEIDDDLPTDLEFPPPHGTVQSMKVRYRSSRLMLAVVAVFPFTYVLVLRLAGIRYLS